MAESSSISILGPNLSTKMQHYPPPSQTIPNYDNKSSKIFVDKTLSSASNLIKLLPSCTLLAFQSLSPTFANHGNCDIPHRNLTTILIGLCTLSCWFFSFTDSFITSDGKLYYGIATFRGLYVFNKGNAHGDEVHESTRLKDLGKFRIKVVDMIHAFFSCLMFLSLALADTDVQKCFLPGDSYATVEDLLRSLPIGVGLFSSLIFMIFPTTRRGIGYADVSQTPTPTMTAPPRLDILSPPAVHGVFRAVRSPFASPDLALCTENLGFESSNEKPNGIDLKLP
ncbi:Protein DMP [Dillenia turbinata]|uniref:Protein DMP n=1 Tax=Dillenia turbinata TaxID=194707 RepID=A0AAN8VVT3_9MAGN